MASGSKPPVKVGARGTVERQLGAPTLKQSQPPTAAPDDFALPPGYKNRYQEHREAQAEESRRNRQSRPRSSSSHPPRARPTGRRPTTRSGGRSRSSRSTSPSLANPTGGRLPIGFDGEGIAGIFFGMVLYALVISVADYGVQGPAYWFKAKFMNQPAPAKGSSK